MNTTRKIFILLFCCLILTTTITGCGGLNSRVRKMLGCAKDSDQGLDIIQPLINSEVMIFNKIWPLLLIGILGVGASFFLIVQGNLKWGIGGAVACGTVLALSVTLIEHLQIIAWVGSAIIILLIVYALWQAWIQRQALKQTVLTAELAKDKMDIVAKAVVFGKDEDGKDHGEAGKIQTKSTEKLIKKIRTTS